MWRRIQNHISAREEGLRKYSFWQVTEYLVKTSEELSAPGNEEYAAKFIELIAEQLHYTPKLKITAITEPGGNSQKL